MPGAYLDESEQAPFLGIGGFYASVQYLPRIEAAWRKMKVDDLGLDPDDELKWNLPEDHSTRKKLDAAGKGGRLRNEVMIGTLASLPLTIVCVVMRDNRGPRWRQIIGQRSVRDFYCEGLRYALQRCGNQAYQMAGAEQWMCVVDRPEGLTKLSSRSASTQWLDHGLKAAHALYREAMTNGPGRGPQGPVLPLRQLGFGSGLLVGHASHDDLLQIADCIAGAVTSLVKDTADGKATTWLIGIVKTLVPRFRGGRGGMFGDGFVLWPTDQALWAALMASLL